LLALLLFSPALVLEPQLLAISLAIACALLVVVEAVRISRVPWLGPRIHSFMTSFIDERDSGLLLVPPSPSGYGLRVAALCSTVEFDKRDSLKRKKAY
jgi:hypothetical protein